MENVNVIVISKESVPKDEHDRLIKSLQEMGYKVADCRANNMADVMRDIRVEVLR